MDRDPMQLALSTDIVMDNVLSYLKVTDLLSCREVSKIWNKSASSVFRKRSAMMKTISNEQELMKVEEFMRQSSDFPFAGLNIRAPWNLHSAGAIRFFKNYGARFTRLRTDMDGLNGLHYLDPFLNHLPRLSILEVGLSHPSCMITVGLAAPRHKALKLTSVRTIRFLGPCSQSVFDKGLREVITAASPSVQIECLDVNPKLVRALQSAGRLRSVSFMKFGAEEDDNSDGFWTEMDQLLLLESPSLTKLDFHGPGSLSLKGLEKILVSSQHTLKELHLYGSWLSEYSWENFPVLTKLTKFSLNVANNFFHGSLFHGRHGHKFPALKELRLCFQYDCCRGLFVVPSITRLELQGHVDRGGMEQLAQSFPNVIN